MKDVGTALAAGLRAPVRRVGLVCLLWLARLGPIVLVFGLPAFEKLRARTAHHPDAGRLLAPAADKGELAWAWTQDLVRVDLAGTGDTIFWLIVVAWILVTVLAGGITARLVHGGATSGLFLAECGRYAGRFVRLALVAAVLVYALDVVLNTLWLDAHREAAKLHHTQAFSVTKAAQRGLLFLALLYLMGALHAYARIDIVTHERRSVVFALLRACGTLLARFPKLVLLEGAMLLAAGAAALVAWLLMRAVNPVGEESGWVPIAIFLAIGLVASYLRSAIELGTMEARCRLLVPTARGELVAPVSQKETLPSFGEEEKESW